MQSPKALLVVFLCASFSLACAGNVEPRGQAAGAPQTGQAPSVPAPPRAQPEVPYVPTPNEVVAEMLNMASVTKDDVVYDLGSGDGRIVITAAQKYGARGVGVDINPVRVKEANENAVKAGVTDKVKFVEGDLFATDLSEATVVTLYLLPDVNLRLRPKLWRELKPGTRVVSHSFDMGGWTPEKSAEVNGKRIYFWTIPKDAAARADQDL